MTASLGIQNNNTQQKIEGKKAERYLRLSGKLVGLSHVVVKLVVVEASLGILAIRIRHI